MPESAVSEELVTIAGIARKFLEHVPQAAEVRVQVAHQLDVEPFHAPTLSVECALAAGLGHRAADIAAREHGQFVRATLDAAAAMYGDLQRSLSDSFTSTELGLLRVAVGGRCTRSCAEAAQVVCHAASMSANVPMATLAVDASHRFDARAHAILEAAWRYGRTVTPGEKKRLSAATGLSVRQITTWFANQRQRRVRKAISAPSVMAPARKKQRSVSSTPSLVMSGSATASSSPSVAFEVPAMPSPFMPHLLPSPTDLAFWTQPPPSASRFFTLDPVSLLPPAGDLVPALPFELDDVLGPRGLGDDFWSAILGEVAAAQPLAAAASLVEVGSL